MNPHPAVRRQLPRADRATRLVDLSVAATLIASDTPATHIDRMFRSDRALRCLVVKRSGTLSLLSRDHVEYTLTGRLGYGRSIHTRSTVGDLVPDDTLVVPGHTELAEAAQLILDQPESRRYRDVIVMTDAAPRVVSVSQVFQRLSEDFRYAALHDPLTGLPNRRKFQDRGTALLAAAALSAAVTSAVTSPAKPAAADRRCTIGVLYIDLDGFKAINDTFGHRIGDEILVDFADRLRDHVRDSDVLARLGGDEFAALLLDISEGEAADIAQRIVTAAAAPFASDGHLLYLSASVGIALLNDMPDDSDLSPLEALLREADAAMLKAKNAGRHQVARLDGRGETAPIARNASIRRRLQHAVASQAFTLNFQPQLDIRSGQYSAVEALLRWTDEELGSVPPNEFIPIMELSGDIHRVGRWVIDRVCEQARLWVDAGVPRRIALNVSPLQLAALTLVPDLTAALARHGIPARLIQVEITESSAIADMPRAIDQLNQLRAAGIGIALDDYGTGHSSLAMLRALPLNVLKIDKSFVDDIDTSTSDALLVGGLISTAHALGLTVTAEGIERMAQLTILRDLGCDTVQGFLIARPTTPGELVAPDVVEVA
ncbi:EAL domain-containing protein [Cryobacterium frigoriphilum]|uniref:EAL domain-containing protein n=1 Tax=Cryobacterium frigoriphilum TaxID=1259150 RepID=A0A4R9A8I9_9MICO|nr:EAL domain-containing protein [Cryobacterium frigoriphilum]TFD53967.1 EAL domain-containing protein [Cryobacterium frigoriphilum]